jgi:5-methylthioadenosine/S-adenosylhomocysteine deaminase
MLDMGINVALGTDGAASNNNLNMFEEMHLAAIIHNGFMRNPEIMKPAEVLKMATINGARALGVDAEIGSVEVGKRPGLVLIEGVEYADDLRLTPHSTSRRII